MIGQEQKETTMQTEKDGKKVKGTWANRAIKMWLHKMHGQSQPKAQNMHRKRCQRHSEIIFFRRLSSSPNTKLLCYNSVRRFIKCSTSIMIYLIHSQQQNDVVWTHGLMQQNRNAIDQTAAFFVISMWRIFLVEFVDHFHQKEALADYMGSSRPLLMK